MEPYAKNIFHAIIIYRQIELQPCDHNRSMLFHSLNEFQQLYIKASITYKQTSQIFYIIIKAYSNINAPYLHITPLLLKQQSIYHHLSPPPASLFLITVQGHELSPATAAWWTFFSRGRRLQDLCGRHVH